MPTKYNNLIMMQLLVTVLVAGPAFADQLGSHTFPDINLDDSVFSSAEIELTSTAFSDPGILPDSPFYFAKRFGEGMRLLFTFDSGGKTKLLSEFARTRLSEAYMLIKNEKNEMARNSLKEYMNDLNEIETSSKQVGKNEMEIVKESHDMLEQNSLFLNMVKSNIRENTEPDVEAALSDSVEKKTVLEAEINVTENLTEKIAREEERNRQLFNDIYGKHGQIEGNIREVSDKLKGLTEKLNSTNTGAEKTSVNGLIIQAEQRISQAESALDKCKFGEAISQSAAALQIASNAEKMLQPNNVPRDRTNYTISQHKEVREHENDSSELKNKTNQTELEDKD